LRSLKKKQRLDTKTNQVIFDVKQPKNERNKLVKLIQNEKPNGPPSGPVSLSHAMNTINKYKMNLLYNGQSKTKSVENSASVMKIVESKIKNIEKMEKKDIKELLQTMKQEKGLLEKENEQVFSMINKSENQINLVLSSLKDDITESQKTLNSMIIPVPSNIIPTLYSEINDEYTKSLEGFNIDKSKYPDLKNLDAKELISLSEAIKTKLSSNKDFYLHNGDFKFD